MLRPRQPRLKPPARQARRQIQPELVPVRQRLSLREQAVLAAAEEVVDKADSRGKVANKAKAGSRARADKAAKAAPEETRADKVAKADPAETKAVKVAKAAVKTVARVASQEKVVDKVAKGAAKGARVADRSRAAETVAAAVVLLGVAVSRVAVAIVAAVVKVVLPVVVVAVAPERAAAATRQVVVDAAVAAASRAAVVVDLAVALVDLAAAAVAVEVAAVEPKSALKYRSRRAVTLLELLLALALSIVVLSTIAMAINIYFKMLDVRRTSLEEMQVVRVVTQRMTNDLMMMVQPNEPDLSGLETAMNNAMQAAAKQVEAVAGSAGIQIGGTTTGGATGGGGTAGGGGTGGQAGGGQQGGGQAGGGQAQGGAGQGGSQGTGGQASGGQGQSASKTGGTSQGSQSSGTNQSGQAASGGTGASGTASASGTTSGDAAATTEETTPAPVVKLVGSAAELRFDISRLPRIDQYQGIMTQTGELSATDLPSDVKTIVYFIRSEQSAQASGGNPNSLGGEASTDGYGRGLMRAELDRAVNLYAESAGGTESAYAAAQLLADEVVGLGFEYFDGTEWLTEWDSATSGGLPRAIRVWLSIQPTYGMSEEELANLAPGKEVPSTDFYFVISLPTAPLVAPTTTESTENTDPSTSSSSTGTSGSSTGTTQGTTP